MNFPSNFKNKFNILSNCLIIIILQTVQYKKQTKKLLKIYYESIWVELVEFNIPLNT